MAVLGKVNSGLKDIAQLHGAVILQQCHPSRERTGNLYRKNALFGNAAFFDVGVNRRLFRCPAGSVVRDDFLVFRRIDNDHRIAAEQIVHARIGHSHHSSHADCRIKGVAAAVKNFKPCRR